MELDQIKSVAFKQNLHKVGRVLCGIGKRYRKVIASI